MSTHTNIQNNKDSRKAGGGNKSVKEQQQTFKDARAIEERQMERVETETRSLTSVLRGKKNKQKATSTSSTFVKELGAANWKTVPVQAEAGRSKQEEVTKVSIDCIYCRNNFSSPSSKSCPCSYSSNSCLFLSSPSSSSSSSSSSSFFFFCCREQRRG
jgi:hypothetical protein